MDNPVVRNNLLPFTNMECAKSDSVEFSATDALCKKVDSNAHEATGLRYNGMSLVYFQIFTFADKCEECDECKVKLKIKENSKYIREKCNNEAIDDQIFVYRNNENPINRYWLKGFSFNLVLNNPCQDDDLCGYGTQCSSKADGNKNKDPYQISISGEIKVEVSIFSNKTVSISYRMVIDDREAKGEEQYNFVKSTGALTTDHVINLISLAIDAEHWGVVEQLCEKCGSYNLTEEKNIVPSDKDGKVMLSYTCQNCKNQFDKEFSYGSIAPEIDGLTISELYIDSDGTWIDKPSEIRSSSEDNEKKQNKPSENGSSSEDDEEKQNKPNHTLFKEVFRRYKQSLLNLRIDAECVNTPVVKKLGVDNEDSTYAFVDIWESFQLNGERVQLGNEANFISRIAQEHKSELVGLMTLYPSEWSKRAKESFFDACGDNIALDVDDLVLVNQKVCVVFGTYGIRGEGAATNWTDHLRIRKTFHVSWPEYMLILEMLLIQKHTIEYAGDLLLDSTLTEEAYRDPIKTVEDNAKLHLDITKKLSELDAVKYLKFTSHRIMFERTQKRLKVEKDRDKLEKMIARIDDSFKRISDIHSLQQAENSLALEKFGGILAFIMGMASISSLLQFITSDINLPLLEHFKWAKHYEVAIGLKAFSVLLFIFCLIILLWVIITRIKERRKKNKRSDSLNRYFKIFQFARYRHIDKHPCEWQHDFSNQSKPEKNL